MKIFIASVFALAMMAAPAHADEDPPNGNDTGCCFSFDDSPVNLVFCMTKDACRIEPPK